MSTATGIGYGADTGSYVGPEEQLQWGQQNLLELPLLSSIQIHPYEDNGSNPASRNYVSAPMIPMVTSQEGLFAISPVPITQYSAMSMPIPIPSGHGNVRTSTGSPDLMCPNVASGGSYGRLMMAMPFYHHPDGHKQLVPGSPVMGTVVPSSGVGNPNLILYDVNNMNIVGSPCENPVTQGMYIPNQMSSPPDQVMVGHSFEESDGSVPSSPCMLLNHQGMEVNPYFQYGMVQNQAYYPAIPQGYFESGSPQGYYAPHGSPDYGFIPNSHESIDNKMNVLANGYPPNNFNRRFKRRNRKNKNRASNNKSRLQKSAETSSPDLEQLEHFDKNVQTEPPASPLESMKESRASPSSSLGSADSMDLNEPSSSSNSSDFNDKKSDDTSQGHGTMGQICDTEETVNTETLTMESTTTSSTSLNCDVQGRKKNNKFCGFCYKNGERAAVYREHDTKEDKKLTCPILQRYRCPLCNATKENAHTLRYCPQNTDQGKGSGSRVNLDKKGRRNARGIVGQYSY